VTQDTATLQPPWNWPVMFPDPSMGCPHQFHWDDADALYRCLYCGETREQP